MGIEPTVSWMATKRSTIEPRPLPILVYLSIKWSLGAPRPEWVVRHDRPAEPRIYPPAIDYRHSYDSSDQATSIFLIANFL
jgi:hypothetical protein